jgi:outer membrane protein TolC
MMQSRIMILRAPEQWRRAIVLMAMVAAGCASDARKAPPPPSVAPATQPSAALEINPSDVRPMYHELLAIDLPTVARVAAARNLDIEQARHRVEAQRGRYEASVQALFPVIAPAITFQHLEGVNQNASGTLTPANFTNVVPGITLQWILNPGKVVYDIVASKKRLHASLEHEQATQLETLRAAAVQYYDLILAHAKVSVARQAVHEAEEALRLTSLRTRAGTGLAADELRSKAFLAARRQDLILAINTFYQASVDLTLTLHLDPTVTLVPGTRQMEQVALVRADLSIEQLMALALEHRPDLQAARTLLAAAKADKSGVVWAALGPQIQSSYSYAGLSTRVNGDTTGLQEQQRGSASAGFNLGLSTFGNMKTAEASFRSAATDVERQMDRVRAQVVSAQQASLTSVALLPISQEQLSSADEALRLAQTNLKSGTMILLDVLQAQNEVDNARLRYADAVVRHNQAQLNLIAAIGLLQADALAPATTRPAAPSTAPAADDAPAATESSTP